MMKHILIVFVLLSLFSCETKYNYIDTGLAKGRYDGTMYDYLHSNKYDWDSTLLMVERAGLQDLFEGKRAGYEKITFFGPTNLSILRWMIEKGYNSIQDVPEDICKELIMRSVITGIHWRDDIPRGKQVLGMEQGEGGEVFTSAFGTRFWIYSFKSAYEEIPEMGRVVLYIFSFDSKTPIDVASTNIETDNGVVHSLDYTFTLGEL